MIYENTRSKIVEYAKEFLLAAVICLLIALPAIVDSQKYKTMYHTGSENVYMETLDGDAFFKLNKNQGLTVLYTNNNKSRYFIIAEVNCVGKCTHLEGWVDSKEIDKPER